MDKPNKKRAQLYIVNLQWTPKDENATLKINGLCDNVMKIVMSHLGIDIPNYNRMKDPIFYHAVKLQNSELSTTSQPCLEEPVTDCEEKIKVDKEQQESLDQHKVEDVNADVYDDDVQTIDDKVDHYSDSQLEE